MKKTQCSTFLLAAMSAVTFASAVHAAEVIRYEDIQNRLGPYGTQLQYRSINVVTTDGKKHHGTGMVLESDRIQLLSGDSKPESLPSRDISRIEIRHNKLFTQYVGQGLTFPLAFGGWHCLNADLGCLASPVVAGAVWAGTIAVAPFLLISDGITSIAPQQVLAITH